MIRITDSLVIDPTDLRESFVRASGPGGQNVNKVATAVELRFNIENLPESLKERLKITASRFLAQSGDLVVTCQTHRSQERNREAALAKLIDILQKAAKRPKFRVATKPSKAAKKRRLDSKSRRSQTKSLRSDKPRNDD